MEWNLSTLVKRISDPSVGFAYKSNSKIVTNVRMSQTLFTMIRVAYMKPFSRLVIKVSLY